MSTETYMQGMEAGAMAYRPVPPHKVPRCPHHGASPDGRDWFLGCTAGIAKAADIFGGQLPQSKTPPVAVTTGGTMKTNDNEQ